VASSSDSFNSEQGFGSPIRRHSGEQTIVSPTVRFVHEMVNGMSRYVEPACRWTHLSTG
jgi:hypothetical protein